MDVKRALLAVIVVAMMTTLPEPPAQGVQRKPGTIRLWDRLPHAADARWAKGRVLVEWRRNIARPQSRRVLAAGGARLQRRIPGLGVDVVKLDPKLSVREAVARFSADPLVRSAQPDYLLFPQEVVPGDEHFGKQWALRNTGQSHPIAEGPGGHTSARGRRDADIDASNAWDLSRGRPSTVIAVLDSGVDVDHPDLAPNLWTNPGEGRDGRDGDRNGYAGDVHGWDFAEDDDGLLERRRIPVADHGTHVAGTAAASLDGSTGVVGVCPRCRIMVLKFMRPMNIDGRPGPDTMGGLQSWELEALAYARREGADILNASFGSPIWSGLERRAYQRLARAGVLPVIAAGNSNGDNDIFLRLDFDRDGLADSVSPIYPASYDLDSLVSVAASNHGDRYGHDTACALERGSPRWPCAFTNWGHDSVDVSAPGVDVISTVPGDGYETFTGTSMAAPHVAGIAGLIESRHPRWNPMKLKAALMNSVDRPAGMRSLHAFPSRSFTGGGFTRTNGRINARRALVASSAVRYKRTDGTIAKAHQLRTRVRGWLAWPRDVNDVYRRGLVRGRSYRVSLRGPRRADFDLIVYKPGTKEIWQIEIACYTGGRACKLRVVKAGPGARATTRFRAYRGGIYYFHVSSLFSRGNYTLRVAPVSR